MIIKEIKVLLLVLTLWVDIKLISVSNTETPFINENYSLFWNNVEIQFPRLIQMLYLNISITISYCLGKNRKMNIYNISLLENPVLYIHTEDTMIYLIMIATFSII